MQAKLSTAFETWFKNGGVDFWSECAAPDELSVVATNIVASWLRSEDPRMLVAVGAAIRRASGPNDKSRAACAALAALIEQQGVGRMGDRRRGAEGERVPDYFMEDAWAAFIMWAAKDQDVLAQYREETGRVYPPSAAKNGLEALIDKATDLHLKAAEHFVIWATEVLWGMDEAPETLRKHIESARSPGIEVERESDG